MHIKFEYPKSIIFAVVIAGVLVSGFLTSVNAKEITAKDITAHYVHIAHQRYLDAEQAAKEMDAQIRNFLNDPSPQTLLGAKDAWVKAHSVYSHTEVFRFGNPNVDAWETAVNSWPMDEGLIDYVNTQHYEYDHSNPHALENIISGDIVIDVTFLEALREGKDPKEAPVLTMKVTDVEANVVTGFHVIEFLLWGQDLNATPKSAGTRPYTDFVVGEKCTNGHCQRRATYLSMASRILLRDFKIIISDWNPEKPTRYSKEFYSLSVAEQLYRIIHGMGSLSYGELAGERIRTALLAGHQEEEQSCFSDTTHLAIYHNAKSIQTLYNGDHQRMDGSEISGPSLADLVKQLDPQLDLRLQKQFDQTMVIADKIVQSAEQNLPFDQMIQPDNQEGHQLLNEFIDALRAQTESIEMLQAKIDEIAAL